MSLNSIPRVTALWVHGIYFLNENWDRLRVIGKAKNAHDNFAEITFLPLRQKYPGLDEQTDPQMKDSVMADILSGYNSIYDLCEYVNFPYFCNILQEPSETFGKKIKQLLRASNNSYPNLFPEIKDTPPALEVLEKYPKQDPYLGQISVLDIHAYNDIILISGGPIVSADDWVPGYPTQEVDYSKRWSFHGLIGKDIILSSSIENKEIGDLLKIVWKAKEKFLKQASTNP